MPGFFHSFPNMPTTPEKVRITLRHLLTMSAGLNASVSGQMLGRDRDPFRHALEPSLGERSGCFIRIQQCRNRTHRSYPAKGVGKSRRCSGKGKHFLTSRHQRRQLVASRQWLSDVQFRAQPAPRDWAKIGQLVLNHGAWEGKQIVPASWIAQSTTEQIRAPKAFSYGFQCGWVTR